ncbi:MAG: hypothetical protein M1820_004164 [Bogoriella megaspora]|nr:MAG: hypothetical protein M1820_004164 [Bogoriella megaspora]
MITGNNLAQRWWRHRTVDSIHQRLVPHPFSASGVEEGSVSKKSKPSLFFTFSSVSDNPHLHEIVAVVMAIKYLILLSRQGKVRLAKWFTTLSPKDKAKIIKDVSQLVLARRTRMCNFLEYKDTKIVYRRYASLFFIAGCDSADNELITLEIVHRYVEQMDKYYGNVCELDIIFNFQKAYFILDELLLAGEMQETSKKNVLRVIGQQDSLEDMEVEDEGVTKIM